MATCRLTPTIRNKTINYKETVQLVISDDEISFSSTGTCDYERFTFCDENHGQVITGDLRLIINTKLKSLLSKGAHYREPNTISYSKCEIAIDSSIDNYGKMQN